MDRWLAKRQSSQFPGFRRAASHIHSDRQTKRHQSNVNPSEINPFHRARNAADEATPSGVGPTATGARTAIVADSGAGRTQTGYS